MRSQPEIDIRTGANWRSDWALHGCCGVCMKAHINVGTCMWSGEVISRAEGGLKSCVLWNMKEFLCTNQELAIYHYEY